jgi:hypothetical protein
VPRAIYRTSDGKRVPGVTTVLQVLNKPALLEWANRIGLEGVNMRDYRDELADIGKCAHYLILCRLTNTEPDLDAYSPQAVHAAENSLQSFVEWERRHVVEVVMAEKPLVSDKHGFGGTPDVYANVDGIPTLMDFKTGKGIYDEMLYQVGGGYSLLLKEHGYPVERAWILNVPRTESEGWAERIETDLHKFEQVFLATLNLHRLLKELKAA